MVHFVICFLQLAVLPTLPARLVVSFKGYEPKFDEDHISIVGSAAQSSAPDSTRSMITD